MSIDVVVSRSDMYGGLHDQREREREREVKKRSEKSEELFIKLEKEKEKYPITNRIARRMATCINYK
jgi:hypothetical protein